MTPKTWGGRFKKPLDPLVEKFQASLPFDWVLYPYDILGSQVHAKMLAKQGLISQDEAQKIVSALTDIQKELDDNQHPFKEGFEDIHMFIECLLVQKIGDVGKKLHTGRSRNDQVALDLRLYARKAGNETKGLLGNFHDVLKTLSLQHAKDKLPGYTHLQQAQPVTLGSYLGAYCAMLNRDIKRLDNWYQQMNSSPLGAGALAGSHLPLDRHYVAKKLGFDGVIENTIDAVSDRDYLVEFCAIASIIMMHLSRLGEDLIIWSSTEFGFVSLDDSFATGSSLMPNKKNPDVPELVRGKTGRVFGHLMGILTVMKGLPLAYNKDMQEDKEGLFDVVHTLKACLTVMAPFMKSITFHTDSMQKAAQSGYLDATKIVELLVLKGLPFRKAHHQVGQWVLEAMEKDMSLKALLQSKGRTELVSEGTF